MAGTMAGLEVACRIYHVDGTGTDYDYVEMECPVCNETQLVRGVKKGGTPTHDIRDQYDVWSWAPGDKYACGRCLGSFVVADWYGWRRPE